MERRKTEAVPPAPLAERSEGSNGRAGVEVMLKGVLFVRRWRGGELDRGESTRPCDTHERASAPWLCGYVCASAGLHRGLDGVLLVVSARPAGQAA
jgi:hypothetical protein